MGNLGEKGDPDWEEVAVEPQYRVVRNRTTLQELELYACKAESESELLQLIKGHEERRTRPLPHTVGLVKQEAQSSRPMCSTFIPYQVYTERIQPRLCDTKDLQHEKAVRLLKDSLVGYSALQRANGLCYDATDRMMGYGQDGQVKVWHNERFCEGLPGLPRHNKNDKDEEDAFIARVIDVIEPHCKDRRLSSALKDHLATELSRPYRFSTIIPFLEREITRSPEQVQPNSAYSTFLENLVTEGQRERLSTMPSQPYYQNLAHAIPSEPFRNTGTWTRTTPSPLQSTEKPT